MTVHTDETQAAGLEDFYCRKTSSRRIGIARDRYQRAETWHGIGPSIGPHVAKVYHRVDRMVLRTGASGRKATLVAMCIRDDKKSHGGFPIPVRADPVKRRGHIPAPESPPSDGVPALCD